LLSHFWGSLQFNATITFFTPFTAAGKHIYMDAVNNKGESGYQLIESWPY
jgi:hypothetical protein